MRSDYTYINTSKEFQTIEVAMKDGTTETFRISPGSVFSQNMIIRDKRPVSGSEIKEVAVTKAGGSKVLVGTGEVIGIENMLKRSVILDIETTGKLGADAITQIGLYDVGKDQGKLIIPAPNLIVRPNRGEAALRTRNKPSLRWAELVDLPEDMTQAELKRAETMFDMIKSGASRKLIGGAPVLTGDETDKQIYEAIFANRRLLESPINISAIDQYMIETDKFQAKQFASLDTLKAAGVSIDLEDRAFQEAIHEGRLSPDDVDKYMKAKSGRNLAELFTGGFELKTNVRIIDAMQQDMAEMIRGNITWIANATFEAKQFGAQIDARMKESFEALNLIREGKGEVELDEKAFIKEFTMGQFEKEIEAINVSRPEGQKLLTKNPFYGVTAAVSVTSGEPFYVTGEEYNLSRAIAAKTGDYTEVYDAIRNYTKAGDVRDILDLVKAQQSALINIGAIENAKRPSNVGIEVQARLLGFTEALMETGSFEEARKRLFDKETHQALGDVKLSETVVLRESLAINEALYQVRQGTQAGSELIAQARRGTGKLYSGLIYGQLLNYVNTAFTNQEGEAIDTLHDVIFRQRAGRHLLDFAEKGLTTTTSREDAFRIIEQATKLDDNSGLVRSLAVPNVRLNKISSYQGLRESLIALEDYPGADKEKILKEIDTQFASFFNPDGSIREASRADFRIRASAYSESAANAIEAMEQRFSSKEFDNFISKADYQIGRMDMRPRKTISRGVGEALGKVKFAPIAAAGLIFGAFAVGEEKAPNKSLIISNYDQFLEAQSQFYNGDASAYLTAIKEKYNIEGMSESGIAADLRKMFTDFGSPYQNPAYSQSVLEDFRLRKERNKYIQSQFNKRHFSAEGDIGFFFKKFIDSAFRKEYGYAYQAPASISGNYTPISSDKYNSLRGDNLVEYTFDNGFDINVEDADTITIKGKGNIDSPLSSFMGTGNTFKFRFAGIDAPETAHEGRSAQPFAEEAKRIAQDMIMNAKELKVVVEPGDSTYGRQVGMVYADGKSVNLELVKRGAAAYLPYKGKAKPSMYNQEAFETAQENAQKSQRGMWREGFFQAYKAVSDASGESVTFNTLVNIGKIAQNSSLMSMSSLMNQAQEMGMVNTAMLEELTMLGEDIKEKGNAAFKPDNMRSTGWAQTDLEAYGRNPNTITTVLEQLKSETGGMMRTRGSKNFTQKLSVKAISENNMILADNTLSARETPIEKAPKISNADRYKRSNNMANMQQAALANIFNSPIGHYRM
jgi:endonuclease YncB( thermonuclease family)